MDKSDARIYFISENQEDLLEEYEEVLFQAKNFVLNSIPLRKLYQARIGRLKKIEEAYALLGGEINIRKVIRFDEVLMGETVKKVFNDFQSKLAELKAQLMIADSLTSVIFLMEQYLELYRLYALNWIVNISGDEKIIISKEPDVMSLRDNIQDFENSGGKHFKDIQQLNKDNPLMIEAKRLSLWIKLENNAG